MICVVLSNGEFGVSGRKERINTRARRGEEAQSTQRNGGRSGRNVLLPSETDGTEARPFTVQRAWERGASGFPCDIKMNTMYADVVGRRPWRARRSLRC